ncbi:GntR family transcriptional regulator [Kitasatospora sp. NPDC001540]|uniref:GntR family transcriptional regulator n=1 Tax=Kitasatospora sp. NPDC001540 TaxID=3364014 RepID=UPI00369822F8
MDTGPYAPPDAPHPPHRERLTQERLAGRFGVSRTPVREALTRLRSDGAIRDGG